MVLQILAYSVPVLELTLDFAPNSETITFFSYFAGDLGFFFFLSFFHSYVPNKTTTTLFDPNSLKYYAERAMASRKNLFVACLLYIVLFLRQS